MKKFIPVSIATALLASMVALASTTAAMAAETASATVQVPGEKKDSGLANLPHYSLWADPTGKNPLRHALDASGGKPVERLTVGVSTAR